MTDLQLKCDLSPLRAYVQDTLLAGRTVADTDELLLSGMLDSLAVMSLVSFVEQTYALKVPFEDVVIENFESLEATGRYVDSRGADA
ncbi:MAG: phosphopantetheine-binding protein [Rhodobacteraceae bacterium]|nr:phosphopantetheine-binding protein [Paracoccaceae bacterium]